MRRLPTCHANLVKFFLEFLLDEAKLGSTKFLGVLDVGRVSFVMRGAVGVSASSHLSPDKSWLKL